MSESLMFALLGFLVACLLGTIFASFLWRRAVIVTKRRISEDEDFADLEEVAALKADLRELQSAKNANSRELSAKNAELAALEAAKADAENQTQEATESLRQELTAAETALETANREGEEAKSLLKTEQDANRLILDAKEAERADAQARVGFLETSIQTLAANASALLPGETDTPDSIATTQPLSGDIEAGEKQESPTSPVASNSPDGKLSPKTKDDAGVTFKDDASVTETTSANRDPSDQSAIDVTRSLEERIEALKQGQTTH